MEKRRIEENRGSAAKAKGVWIGKGIESVKSKDRSGMRRLPPQSPSGCDKGNEREIVESFEKVEQSENGRNKLAR